MAKQTVKKAAKKSVVTAKKAVSVKKKPSVNAEKAVSVTSKKTPAMKKTATVLKKTPVPVKKATNPVVAKKTPVAVKRQVPVQKTTKKAVQIQQPSVVLEPLVKKSLLVADKRLSDAEISAFKEKLLTLRARLCGNINTMTAAALNKNQMEASGDMSSSPIHMADIGSDNFEQEQTLTFVQSEGELLDLIDEALERIKEGTYGVCESCECPIPKGRLNIIPYASMCVKCAEIVQQQNGWS